MRPMLAWMCAGSLASAGTEIPAAKEWNQGEPPPLPYRWHTPETIEPGRKYPLVLFLHGAGERGSDNTAQLKHGVTPILDWSRDHNQPCFLLAPQCPPEAWWCDIDHQTWLPVKTGNPNAVMRKVIALLADTAAQFPVDPARLYVTGLSMGGYGTWFLLESMPERLAAAIPICGGGNPAAAAHFKEVPVWVFHGGADDVVPPSASRAMVEAVQHAGGKPKFTDYPGVKHDSWSATYRDDAVLRWLFDQHKSPKN